MKKKVLSALALTLSLSISPAFADDTGTLDSYLKEGEVAGGGVCDSLRSTVAVFNGKSYTKLTAFIPVNPDKRFYIVEKGSVKEFYVQSFAGGKVTGVRKLSVGPFADELFPESPNFLMFVFGQGRMPHDCMIGQN